MGENTGKAAVVFFAVIFIGFICLIVLNGLIVNVGPGYEGVLIDKMNGGVQPIPLSQGWHMVNPITQSVIQMRIATQLATDETSCSSKDLQIVTTTIAVKYHPVQGTTPWIYNNVGPDYTAIVIDPGVKDSIKAITAKYDAQELISRRESVRQEMAELIDQKLKPFNLITDGVDITNFNFSDQYEAAIEAKQVAQQNVQQKQFELMGVQIEANKTVAMANAQAQAIEIKGKALKDNPGVVDLNWIDRWDGKVPYMWGGSQLTQMLPAPA